MKTYHRRVGTRPVVIHYPENSLDLIEGEGSFWDMLRRNEAIAIDTEGTGLYAFAPGFIVRLVQFGTASEAWVLRADQFEGHIKRALQMVRKGLYLNATYDTIALDVRGFASYRDLLRNYVDVGVLSKIRDPRSASQGGTGHKLKELAQHFLDRSAKDPKVALSGEFKRVVNAKAAEGVEPIPAELHPVRDAKAYKAAALQYRRAVAANVKALGGLDAGWRLIEIDNDEYIVYAGFDVLYTAALYPILRKAVIDRKMEHLVEFDHNVQRICAGIEYRGMRNDEEYTIKLRGELDAEYHAAKKITAAWGVPNPNSLTTLANVLLGMGEEIPERTAGGQVQVDAKVLARLANVNIKDWDEELHTRKPNVLAREVMRAKRALKWREAYAQGALNMRDAAGYIHPSLNSIAARTTRMSVSGWPAQQIPTSDARIRRMIIANEGNVLVSADYDAIELRILAIAGHETVLIDAIKAGVDLHGITGRQMFGDAWDDAAFAESMRGRVKTTTYCKAFGGGASAISAQVGLSIEEAKKFSRLFDTGYPGIKEFSDRLRTQIQYSSVDYIETVLGRRIYVDQDTAYAASNSYSQASGADILKLGLIKQDEQGIADHLIAVVHDECIGDVPKEDAEEYSRLLGKCMSVDLAGAPLSATGKILGAHWRK